MSPNKIGPYKILQEIGRGGLGVVYLAMDTTIGREVAIKVLPWGVAGASESEARNRFLREARIIASLENTFMVPVYEYNGNDEQQPYLVMRYMSGGTLVDRIRKGPMPLSQVIPIVKRLAGALDIAHNKHIVHRDVKPSNVMFDTLGEAYLSDFGIAKLTETDSLTSSDSLVGTPAYMSPEQIRGENIDGRSDIYGLGLVLYEMLTGVHPYRYSNISNILHQQLEGVVPKLSVAQLAELGLHPRINGILAKALNKDPKGRYLKAGDLAVSLEGLLSLPDPIPFWKIKTLPHLGRLTSYLQSESFRKVIRLVTIVIIFSGIISTTIQILPQIYSILALSQVSATPTLTILPTGTVGQTGTVTIGPTVTATPTTAIKNTPSPTATSTQQLPISPYTGTLGFGLVLALGLLIVSVWAISNYQQKSTSLSRQKGIDQPSFLPASSTGTMTINLIAAFDPRKQKEVIRIIGRDQELRLKDVIVHFSGGRYLLRGFGRFGASILIEKIIDAAKADLAKHDVNKQGGVIMAVQIRASDIRETGPAVSAIVHGVRFEEIRGGNSRAFTTTTLRKLNQLKQNKAVDVVSLLGQNTVSLKAGFPLGFEVALAPKSDTSLHSPKVTGDKLLDVFVEFLDKAEQKKIASLEALMQKILGNENRLARLVFVIDQVKSEEVFDILSNLRLFDDPRIMFFAIVRQEVYTQWPLTVINKVNDLKFESCYVPCLWEDETNFVSSLIAEAFSPKESTQELENFKDHIAYIARGAPGDAVRTVSHYEYCDYSSGYPVLKLETIRQRTKELIGYNAQSQRTLDAVWKKVVSNQLSGPEEHDQARRGIYETLHWINQRSKFTWREIKTYSDQTQPPIHPSLALKDEILADFLQALVDENYLSKLDNKRVYRVMHRNR